MIMVQCLVPKRRPEEIPVTMHRRQSWPWLPPQLIRLSATGSSEGKSKTPEIYNQFEAHEYAGPGAVYSRVEGPVIGVQIS